MSIQPMIRTRIKEGLKELSDREFQERVWVRGAGPEVSSPVESVSQLFDDTGLGDLLEDAAANPVFSREIDATLIALGRLLDDIDLDAAPEDIVSDEKWADVRRLANMALDAIDAHQSTD